MKSVLRLTISSAICLLAFPKLGCALEVAQIQPWPAVVRSFDDADFSPVRDPSGAVRPPTILRFPNHMESQSLSIASIDLNGDGSPETIVRTSLVDDRLTTPARFPESAFDVRSGGPAGPESTLCNFLGCFRVELLEPQNGYAQIGEWAHRSDGKFYRTLWRFDGKRYRTVLRSRYVEDPEGAYSGINAIDWSKKYGLHLMPYDDFNGKFWPNNPYFVDPKTVERVDWLLEPSGDHDADLRRGVRTDAYLQVSWVSRRELKAQKERLSSVTRPPDDQGGFTSSEHLATFLFWNDGRVGFELTGSISPPLEKQEGLQSMRMWTVWLAPAKAQSWFRVLTADYPASDLAKMPIVDDSVCVILWYVQDNKAREMHFYLPSITYVYRIIGDLRAEGEDTSKWENHDERYLTQEWVREEKRIMIFQNIFKIGL